MYERGVVKTEIIDGKEFTGKEPACPYQVIELDKKQVREKFIELNLSMRKIWELNLLKDLIRSMTK